MFKIFNTLFTISYIKRQPVFFSSCSGWAVFVSGSVGPVLPSVTRPGAEARCHRWYRSLTAGAPFLPQGWGASYPHGFFICGSYRINVLFYPSKTGIMDQHFLSPTHHIFMAVSARLLPPCFLHLTSPALKKPHPLELMLSIAQRIQFFLILARPCLQKCKKLRLNFMKKLFQHQGVYFYE